ncbi:MAG: hypothetical protein U0T56_04550 [Ferruginibacter sp.]|jgi:hypothetical protein
MKKVSIVLSFVILLTGFSNRADAQYYFYDDSYYDSPLLFEVGASVGAMNCFTDLGGKKGIGKRFIKDLNLGKTEMAMGAYFSVMYKYAIGLRLEASFGKVGAYDSILAKVPTTDIARARYNRNLHFRSNITEFSLMAEMHPLFMFIDWSWREQEPPRYSPYLLAGIGYYSFNPQAQLGRRWVDLQPLSTEGQGFPEYPDRQVYKLKQINFPVGIGVKYELSSILNLRGEFVYRILNTDYLDDVSTTYIDPQAFLNNLPANTAATAIELSDRQRNKITGPGGKRGSPAEKDSYFTFNLKLGLMIGRERIR